MKITPLEIRQKTFQKGFRGFDKDEVEAFLLSLSQEWERMVEENKEYKIKLEQAHNEVAKLREVEDSLFKTLKTAETTGANVVEQANKSAELIVQESRMKAEQTLDDAQRKADKIFTQMLTEFSELEREFRSIENLRDNLLSEVRNLATDSLDRLTKVTTDRKNFDHIKNMATKLSVEKELKAEDVAPPKAPVPPVATENAPKPVEEAPKEIDYTKKNLEQKEPENTPKIENTPKSTDNDEGSFFDQI